MTSAFSNLNKCQYGRSSSYASKKMTRFYAVNIQLSFITVCNTKLIYQQTINRSFDR